jgi:hypothetical protein
MRTCFAHTIITLSAKKGALVSLRPPPDLSYSKSWKFAGLPQTTPAVAVSPERRVFTCVRESPERVVHACTKHVLGGLFSGHLKDWAETEDKVILALISESEIFNDRPTKSLSYNEHRLRTSAQRVVDLLRQTISKEVEVYIKHFATKIADHKINLTWDPLFNNCQAFCKSLMRGGAFDTVLPTTCPSNTAPGQGPRYLLSFASENPGSKHDSARYTTTPSAAYFSNFHIDEDLIEYFETWLTIPLQNPCAKLLCWPCINDDDCSLRDHMWLMPFETMSLLQLHLLRNRRHYSRPYQTTDPFEEESEPWNDHEWFRNRLEVLLAQDTFLCAAGALVASYQVLWEASREANSNPQWVAPAVEEVGRSILNSYKPGDGNFTIENPKKSWWSLKDRAMQKHLSKNTISTTLQSDAFDSLSVGPELS